MAKLLPIIPAGDGFNMYLRLRYLLAGIARCLKFFDKDLMEVATSAPCRAVAARSVEHFFHKSRQSAIYADMTLMFQCLITIALILQRQLNSMGFDWHAGTILTWFRVNTAAHVGRFYLGSTEHPRVPDPLALRQNLQFLNIHDSRFVETMEMLCRAYYGRPSTTGKLANALFDPVMLCQHGDRSTLRVSNRIYRLEKQPFPSCIDLRKESTVILSYRVQRQEFTENIPLTKQERQQQRNRNRKTKPVLRCKLDITIDEKHISQFKAFVKTVIHSGLSLKYKIVVLDRRVGAFSYSIRYARNGFDQVLSLSRWLRYRLAPLCVEAEGKAKKRPDPLYDLLTRLPDIMLNKFMMGSDYKRYYRRQNFFYDPNEHDELTLIRFLSPYREGGE